MADSNSLRSGISRTAEYTPQPLEIRTLDEDWTGLADSAHRRKLQNRLNQRLYRRRRRAKPGPDSSESDTCATIGTLGPSEGLPLTTAEQHEMSEQGLTYAGVREKILQDDIQPSEKACSNDKTKTKTKPKSLHAMSQIEIRQLMAEYEVSAHQAFIQCSPRTDQLLTLIQFNVFRALVENTTTINFTMDWLEEDSISPWCRPDALDESRVQLCPVDLQPTQLQREVSHHPWIDLFPIPQMRDNLLRHYDDFDEGALCNDLVDFYEVSNDQTGLIVWRRPWQPAGWEVSETFLRKWRWVVEGCDGLFESTNYWRAMRGEDPLVFNT
ncbi:uncharacterized protein N7511_007854 [Penicillium nucicola]|uniref:uncharacterized protein n=1 Tax=Penicillium nucicola TaxID=1850975 RepID=UPI0025450266|nr:uncharacterized protein N7511_007854 [Penicillium nucicola]KAJ5753701.1 hypothetical protein N7511_007854 [Penicillium nucicola]